MQVDPQALHNLLEAQAGSVKTLHLTNLILKGGEKLLSRWSKGMPGLINLDISLKGSPASYEGLFYLCSDSKLVNFQLEAAVYPHDMGIITRIMKQNSATLCSFVFGALQVDPENWLALGRTLLDLPKLDRLRLFDGQPRRQRMFPSLDVEAMVKVLSGLGTRLTRYKSWHLSHTTC